MSFIIALRYNLPFLMIRHLGSSDMDAKQLPLLAAPDLSILLHFVASTNPVLLNSSLQTSFIFVPAAGCADILKGLADAKIRINKKILTLLLYNFALIAI
jgi:hypothetical protein